MSAVGSSDDRVQQRLRDCVAQMLRSVAAYDDGHVDEARRLALSCRVLLHDTKRQTSLLTHLGLKHDITYYDTASEIDPRQHGSHFSLLSMVIPEEVGGPGAPRMDARLDSQPRSPKDDMQSFEQWWSTPVIRDDRGRQYSRADIVLYLADKDGGAHVDLDVDPDYLRLASGQATEWRPHGPDAVEFAANIELACARQVAHEVLVTLARHTPWCFSDSAQAACYADEPLPRAAVALEITDVRVYTSREDTSRNDPCWCGSGTKYKKCHGSAHALGRHDEGKRPWSSRSV